MEYPKNPVGALDRGRRADIGGLADRTIIDVGEGSGAGDARGPIENENDHCDARAGDRRERPVPQPEWVWNPIQGCSLPLSRYVAAVTTPSQRGAPSSARSR